MSKHRDDDIRIATEAAQWQRALESGDPARQREFSDWLKASPRHVREFLFMESLDAAARHIDPSLQPDLDLQLPAENPVPRLRPATVEQPERPQRRFQRTRFASIAAMLMSVAIGLTWWIRPGLLDGWQRYSTQIGEQRSVQLPDGSVLQLNTNSQLRVKFSKQARDIELSQGEALFKVAHDKTRPFVVRAADVTVRAIGTEFNVYRRADETQVAVVEGKVEVRKDQEQAGAALRRAATEPDTAPQARLVAAGEAVRVTDKAGILRAAQDDVADVTAWRQRRLVFREDTLARIAEEFNRYNRRPQIVVEGTARNHRYGGTFDADDPESLVQLVSRTDHLSVERSAERIVLRAP